MAARAQPRLRSWRRRAASRGVCRQARWRRVSTSTRDALAAPGRPPRRVAGARPTRSTWEVTRRAPRAPGLPRLLRRRLLHAPWRSTSPPAPSSAARTARGQPAHPPLQGTPPAPDDPRRAPSRPSPARPRRADLLKTAPSGTAPSGRRSDEPCGVRVEGHRPVPLGDARFIRAAGGPPTARPLAAGSPRRCRRFGDTGTRRRARDPRLRCGCATTSPPSKVTASCGLMGIRTSAPTGGANWLTWSTWASCSTSSKTRSSARRPSRARTDAARRVLAVAALIGGRALRALSALRRRRPHVARDVSEVLFTHAASPGRTSTTSRLRARLRRPRALLRLPRRRRRAGLPRTPPTLRGPARRAAPPLRAEPAQ